MTIQEDRLRLEKIANSLCSINKFESTDRANLRWAILKLKAAIDVVDAAEMHCAAILCTDGCCLDVGETGYELGLSVKAYKEKCHDG